MNIVQELKIVRQRIRELDIKIGQIVQQWETQHEQTHQDSLPIDTSENNETICPLSAGPAIFKGEKPAGVIFGESDRVDVGTWKKIFREILRRCNADPEKHVSLMNLRGRVVGRERVLLSRDPDGMRSPLKIADNLYIETHYDTETLFRILMTRILDTVNYDYSHISVAIRNN
jgi:hypothetical protein